MIIQRTTTTAARTPVTTHSVINDNKIRTDVRIENVTTIKIIEETITNGIIRNSSSSRSSPVKVQNRQFRNRRRSSSSNNMKHRQRRRGGKPVDNVVSAVGAVDEGAVVAVAAVEGQRKRHCRIPYPITMRSRMLMTSCHHLNGRERIITIIRMDDGKDEGRKTLKRKRKLMPRTTPRRNRMRWMSRRETRLTSRNRETDGNKVRVRNGNPQRRHSGPISLLPRNPLSPTRQQRQ
mmetsp:Transcript_24512/g.29587  ORF Transcript_24512/g.29587 Transcript_24512/m.29587 type:complete len:235 (+) Transcript_24512:275-979(+)